MLGGVMDPELKASIVELGMVHDVDIAADGTVTVHIALTTLGCPLQAEIRREIQSKLDGLDGVTDVKVRWVEMTQEQKTAAMQRARLNAREHAPTTEIPATTRVLAVVERQGRSRQELGHRQPRRRARPTAGLHVGVLDADIWGFSVPRMLGVDGRLSGADGKIIPHHRDVAGGGSLEIISMGFLVDDESTALMWRGLILTKARRAVPHGRAMGRARLPARRHAARYRRRPDGAGALAAPGRDARRDHAGARGAEGRDPRGGHGTPLVHEGRRRRREHERVRRTGRSAVRVVRDGWRCGAGRGDRRAIGGVDTARARGVRRRGLREPGRARRTRLTGRCRVPRRSPPGSSTSCSLRSRWRAAPPASSRWPRRTSRRSTPPNPDRPRSVDGPDADAGHGRSRDPRHAAS